MTPHPSELILRHVYFDEAGLASEPYTVVGGFMIHVDQQYGPLQKYLLDMADYFVGEDRPPTFSFQAKELWHGEGFFPRDKWPLPKRMEILSHLADIPKKFGFPVIYSCVERAPYLEKIDYQQSAREIRRAKARILSRCHTFCFMSCLSQSDKWMAQFHKEERIFAVVEHHDDHKSLMLGAAQIFSDPRAHPIMENDPKVRWSPLKYIVEEPLFVRKSGSSPLQLADTCAFILSRSLTGGNHTEGMLKRFEPMLVRGFKRQFFLGRVAGTILLKLAQRSLRFHQRQALACHQCGSCEG